MKYRTNQTEVPVVGTEFSTTTQLYKLDEVTGKLIEAGFQDDFEFIQSSSDICLSKVLERFGYVPEDYLNQRLPQKYFDGDEPVEALQDIIPDMFPSQTQNVIAYQDTNIELIRQQLGADSTATSSQVLDLALQALQKQSEVKQNETKNQGQSEPPTVQEHSSQNAQA